MIMVDLFHTLVDFGNLGVGFIVFSNNMKVMHKINKVVGIYVIYWQPISFTNNNSTCTKKTLCRQMHCQHYTVMD